MGKPLFDIWCLIHPDYRQIAKRFIIGNRPDLSKVEVADMVNTHINANKPMLLARDKKLRYWESLIGTKPPWAEELHLYQAGLGPESENLHYCEQHQLHHSADSACSLCKN